jgi:hypothetical protein
MYVHTGRVWTAGFHHVMPVLAWHGYGDKEDMSSTYICMYILGAFGLLDFTMLVPVLAWHGYGDKEDVSRTYICMYRPFFLAERAGTAFRNLFE